MIENESQANFVTPDRTSEDFSGRAAAAVISERASSSPKIGSYKR